MTAGGISRTMLLRHVLLMAIVGLCAWLIAASLLAVLVGATVGGALSLLLGRRHQAARQQRQHQAIMAALPDALELLAAAVAGGAASELALRRVAAYAAPPLNTLLAMAVADESGRGLGIRLRETHPALRPLGSLLQQSDELGVPIAGAVRLLAADARLRARAAARERAAAAAPKMLLVVGGLLAPAALLIVIGGQFLVLRTLIGPVLL